MSDGALRFLLDQQFPKAPFDVHSIDRSVTYEHLSDYGPQYSQRSTPDWMLHLVTAEGRFDAVVTVDRSQLEEEVELVALNLSEMSVITWRGGEEDPIVLWGQLLAYMPQVVKVLSEIRPAIVTLPNPRLQNGKHIEKPGELARAMKRHDKASFPERRARSLAVMMRDLEARGEAHLGRHLLPKKQK